MTAHHTDVGDLDWHTISVEDVAQRMSVSPSVGLENEQVARKAHEHGKNAITPPKTNWPKKVFLWVFGGFGGILFVASVICFIGGTAHRLGSPYWLTSATYNSLATPRRSSQPSNSCPGNRAPGGDTSHIGL